MNSRIVKNKYINALFLLMLFSAIVHMAILFFKAIKSLDVYVLNYFNILDIDLFYPNIFNNFGGNVFSLIFMVAIYFIILKINKTE
jgi:hypothetical protein